MTDDEGLDAYRRRVRNQSDDWVGWDDVVCRLLSVAEAALAEGGNTVRHEDHVFLTVITQLAVHTLPSPQNVPLGQGLFALQAAPHWPVAQAVSSSPLLLFAQLELPRAAVPSSSRASLARRVASQRDERRRK